MRYAFIQQQWQWGVVALCRALQVSRSGYYDWLGRPPSMRARANNTLLQHIRTIHTRHRQAYGTVKTWQALKQQGVVCGKHRVARLRKLAGIEAQRKRRFRVTVAHHHTAEAAPDLLNRQFQAAAPDRIWVGDMTFIRTRQGWLHLAVLLDLFSRKVVGWAMGARPNGALHESALQMALEQRRPQAGLIHHTDRGLLYRTARYRAQMSEAEIRPSMNGRKTAYDNAVAESFFSNLKNEWVHHHDFNTREEATLAIFDYIECFYNRQRIHQSLAYQTPVEVERLYHARAVCLI